jgi:hypothetical protein
MIDAAISLVKDQHVLSPEAKLESHAEPDRPGTDDEYGGVCH